jgi:hypothetical protein
MLRQCCVIVASLDAFAWDFSAPQMGGFSDRAWCPNIVKIWQLVPGPTRALAA